MALASKLRADVCDSVFEFKGTSSIPCWLWSGSSSCRGRDHTRTGAQPLICSTWRLQTVTVGAPSDARHLCHPLMASMQINTWHKQNAGRRSTASVPRPHPHLSWYAMRRTWSCRALQQTAAYCASPAGRSQLRAEAPTEATVMPGEHISNVSARGRA